MARKKRRTKLDRVLRVKQINPLLALGMTIAEIAEQVNCGEKTVRRDLIWQYDEMIATESAEMAAQRAGIISELGKLYAGAVQTEARVSDELKHLYMSVRLRSLYLLTRIYAADAYARAKAKEGYSLPNTTLEAKVIGPIQIVYGPPAYPNDNSDRECVIDLPAAPDDRAACHSTTVSMAANLFELKRQAAHSSDRAPGREI